MFILGQLQPKLHPGAEPIYPSFMAKPDSNLPGNSILMKGCGGHVHLSLISEGINLFWDPNDKYGMSDLFKHFIAGILHCLPFVMPMVYILVSSKYAPNVNSYKRLVANYWAPVMVCWGVENRTASLRVITPKTTGALACSAMGTRGNY